MSAGVITLGDASTAADLSGAEHRTLTPCLGLALGAGLLSWAALVSLVGIVLV